MVIKNSQYKYKFPKADLRLLCCTECLMNLWIFTLLQTWNSLYSFRSQNRQHLSFRKIWGIFNLNIATLCKINAPNPGEMALKVSICGNNTKFCEKSSANWIPQPNFDVFHKSFHNLTQIFREQYSPARAIFHVWFQPIHLHYGHLEFP